MRELSSLLAAAFTSRGYRVTEQAALEGRSGSVYTVPLLAEDDRHAVLVEVRPGSAPTDTETIHKLANMLEDVGASIAVLASLAPTTPQAVEAAARQGVVLWDRATMVDLAGEIALGVDANAPLAPLPLQPPGLTRAPPAASIDAALHEPIPARTSDLLPDAFRSEESTLPELAAALAATQSPELSEEAEIPTVLGIEVMETEAMHTSVASSANVVLEPFPPLPPHLQAPAIRSSPPPAPSAAGRSSGLAALAQRMRAALAPPMPTAPTGPFEPSQVQQPAPFSAVATPTASGLPAMAAQQFSNPTSTTLREPSHATGPSYAMPAIPTNPIQGWLPARLAAEEAARLVREHLFSVDRQQLVLQPVHLFDYECAVFAEGSLKTDSHEGRIQVHGTDKRAVAVDVDEVNPRGASAIYSAAGLDVQEKVLRVSPERAQEIALVKVIELHTRLVDHRLPQENNSFHYTEKRKVTPRPEHVKLKPLGAWHRPMWRMSGANGEMLLDAVSGKVVERQLKSNPDAFVVD